MKRVVSAVEARQRLGELLDGAYYRGDEIVIERAGKVMAVIVPPDLYKSMERRQERLFEIIDEIQARNRNVPASVIERDIAEAIAEVRGNRKAAAKKRA